MWPNICFEDHARSIVISETSAADEDGIRHIKMDLMAHWTDSLTVLRRLHAAYTKQQVYIAKLKKYLIDQLYTNGDIWKQSRESKWLHSPALL